MRTVIKAGGSSLKDVAGVRTLIGQAREIAGDRLVVVSAQGKETDRIIDAIQKSGNGGKPPKPEEIFREFESMGIPSSYHRGVRDSIYMAFGNAANLSILPESQRTGFYHMAGERLSAVAAEFVANQEGIDAAMVDFMDEDFPLVVRGHYLNASPDYGASRVNAQTLLEKHNGRMIIVPGYGGIDYRSRSMKALGRGGSDTAAFAYLYAFNADELYILTDVNGILDGNVEGGKTVPELDIDEVKDAATLGAKLPGRKAVQGLELCYAENSHPGVYIARDVHGERTSIKKETEKCPARLVAGREVAAFHVAGKLAGMEDALRKHGIDFPLGAGSDYAHIIVAGDVASYAQEVLSNFAMRKGGDVTVNSAVPMIYVGVVGNGMPDAAGSLNRAAGTLTHSGMTMAYGRDPGRVSLGYLINGDATRPLLQDALTALHKEFIRK